MAWYQRFSEHWEELKPEYDDRFKRMWNFYLLSCAGAFRSRGIQLWQVVLSKNGIKGGYQAPR
jgi:cyclopropane-fatty-acyl-phospholipid synthase